MKVLIIGGSGHVGKLIIPLLKERHQLRVLDLAPPADVTVEFVQGGVNDEAGLAVAMAGVEGVVYLAMGKDEKGNIDSVGPAYDVNVKGIHYACTAALKAGACAGREAPAVSHASAQGPSCRADLTPTRVRFVYMSTLSVYGGPGDRYFGSEDEPPDSPTIYGFTKFLGEEVLRHFCLRHGLNGFALRLNWPVPNDKWNEAVQKHPSCGATAGDDLARAVLAALECVHSGFDAVFITGDYEGRKFNPAKAKRLLGWEAQRRS